jgi:hypothetical protein
VLAAVTLGTAPQAAAAAAPGGPLRRSNVTPFAPSRAVVGARWASGRYDPPANQAGDILPTVWSEDGGTYVLMDDGGVDVPVRGALWRQSFARVTGAPPKLRFRHVGDPSSPPPRTWAQIGSNWDNDDGPLGPYYSIGFVEADGMFYATMQRNWRWGANGPFTGLAGMAYSRDKGRTWHVVRRPFPAPVGNLTFVDGGGRGGVFPDGYVYAIGTEREFNASRLLLARARPGIQNMTDPRRWQWFGGFAAGGDGSPVWVSSPQAASPLLSWTSHITYPQMTYDAPLHRFLLTFTYSYGARPPAVWKGGAELMMLEGPSLTGPFSFVARSPRFGPSNGYGAGFPSQWISRDGRDLWLKWAANFAGCNKGLDCTGKYGFNVARIHLSVPRKPVSHARRTALEQVRTNLLYALPATVLLMIGLALRRRLLRD